MVKIGFAISLNIFNNNCNCTSKHKLTYVTGNLNPQREFLTRLRSIG